MPPVPPLLAQVNIPTEPPATVAAVLLLVLGLLLTGWLRTKQDYDGLRERCDRLETALELQREATQTALEANRAHAEGMAELKDLGRLLRRVLEALPQADDTPDPPPRSTTGRRRP